jgi:RNA polymerase sigma-70 factor (ECF subfamily)
MTSDGELIQAAATGDRSAFEDLYRRYARPVFGLALRRLGDRGRAEDAVQETFASIWRSAGSYQPERGPGAPWLYAVARNAIVDRARSRTEIPAEIPD